MAVPASRTELLAAIDTTIDRLLADLRCVPADRASKRSMTRHVARTQMSPTGLVTYLIGGNDLVL